MALETPEPGRASTLLLHPYTDGPHANQAKRIWFKLHTKYGGDVSKVTDCARISLEFATAEGLERAANFVLPKASSFKNRVAYPTEEGYRDLTFTVPIGGHVCEVSSAPLPCCLQHHQSHGMGSWELQERGGSLVFAVRASVVAGRSASSCRSHEMGLRAFCRRYSCT